MGTDLCKLCDTSDMYQSQNVKCTIMSNFIHSKNISIKCFKESWELTFFFN